jgi:stress response protein YsnF
MKEPERQTIPLVEEDLSVEIREVETGRVRIRTLVDEHVELARADLARDRVEVERVPVGREVDQVPAVREEGDTLIVPVVEEILVVEKRLYLREELRLIRRRTVEPFEAPVTLRRTRAVVERSETQDSENEEKTS